MNVSDKGAKIWRKDIESKKGTFYRYSVSVSKKREDGTYASVYVPIIFAKKANMPEKITNGAKCDYGGFLSVDERPDREGNTIRTLQIVAMNARLTDADDPSEGVDSFAEAEMDIPFK